jgi:hypothetical protein
VRSQLTRAAFIAVLILVGLTIQIPSHAAAVAASAAVSPVAAIGAKTLPATKTVQVPLVVCSTEFGMKPSHLPKLPKHLYLKVSGQVGRGAAVYTDKLGHMRVVGPRGWWCGASVGVDGSDNVKVYPVGGPTQKSGVTANETSACVGCTLEQACRLFPGAKKLLRSEYKESCASRPHAEIVYRLNAHIVYFDDPSGVAGDGAMSGGPNPAVGVMTYYSPNTRAGANGSWMYTCTFPASRQALCNDGAAIFATWYRSL